MNNEKIQIDIKNSMFARMNGTILRTLNVIENNRCRLSSFEFAFNVTVKHDELINNVKYLSENGYINLWNCYGKPTEFKADQFNDTEMTLTAKGIQILRGTITDYCIQA